MNIPEGLEKISKALGVLTHQTRAENLAGFFSKNRLNEDLLLPLFRIVFNASNLRNVNQAVANFPYIDLVDDKRGLSIQVTTERAAAKITDTLTGFISNNYHRRYNRLVFFVLTGTKIQYTSKTRTQWKKLCGRRLRFDPVEDVITTLDLFPLIERLPPKKIYSVHDIIAESIIGEKFVDTEACLARQSSQQLEYEKSSGKYIPDIFVETSDTKDLARIFAHPVLFSQRTAESLARLDVPRLNHWLEKMGLPSFPFPRIEENSATHISNVDGLVDRITSELKPSIEFLSKLESTRGNGPPPFPVKKGHEHFYEQNAHSFHLTGWGWKRSIEDCLRELKAAKARIFILTGKAGQGKTNLVCDFVENFLRKHGVPCAYVSARRVGLVKSIDVADTIQRLIFDGETKSFAEAAKKLSAYANGENKPFVLIIDGLNENHRISEFAEQMEHFLDAIMKYPNLKLFVTCRSEFFQQRFGKLAHGRYQAQTFLLETNEHRHDERFFSQALDGYFGFFKIDRRRVSKRAMDSLKSDILLLRFFCEAYGARGKERGYRQPFVTDIYRAEIFQIYLKRKLTAAGDSLRLSNGKLDPTAADAELRGVLKCVLDYMFQNQKFTHVPASTIPPALNDALFTLLDEELILRRDLSESASVFSSTESLNFTYDEFRDFLIAQYLIDCSFVNDQAAFLRFMAQSDPKDSQIIEGIKKFLFYGSRDRKNGVFWKFYKDQQWYKDVYSSELFNIDAKLLREEDREFVVATLTSGGDAAQSCARMLAVHWHPDDYPLLGLNLLLSFVTQADNASFDYLIIQTFKTIRNFNDGTSARAFCEFITKQILPKYKPSADAPEHDLFRFLVLLLPVGDDAFLNSESHSLLRAIVDQHPKYAIEVLRESLQHKPTRHRAHVWRLLAAGSDHIPLGDPLWEEARREEEWARDSDPLIHREVNFFLRHRPIIPSGGSQ